MDPIAIIGYISLAVGSILALFSRIPKQTITNYEQLSVAQEKRIAALEEQSKIDHKNHLENIKAIADLQGQIKVYKELPLQQMAKAMQDISEGNKAIAESNRQILLSLQSSAIIASEGRSTLLHPTQVVEKQTVETQVIKNKK
jgi:hypothetical protein